MNGFGSSRRPRPGRAEALDERILRWLNAPEGANSGPVLDVAFAGLAEIRQQRRWPWSAFADSLTQSLAIRLPRWAWIALVLLLVMSLAFAATAGADRLRPFLDQLLALPAPPAQLSDTSCPAELVSSTTVRCLVATVPERHERQSVGTISLAVTEYRPEGAESGADEVPILIVDSADPLGERTRVDILAQATTAGRRIVSVTLRGIGAGGSLACPEVEALSTAFPVGSLSDPALRGALGDAVRACRERLAAAGIDVSAIEPGQMVADLESVRLGLGIDRWIVGARGREAPLALELLRRYPDGVAGVVLINPALAAVHPGSEAALAAALRELSALCAADSFCSSRYRPPSEAYTTIVALLADGPIAVPVTDPGGSEMTVRVDAALVRATIRDAIVGTTSVGTLPSLLDRMAGGDFTGPAMRLTNRGWCLGSELGCSPGSGWSGGGEYALLCGAGANDLDPWAVICPAWFGDQQPAAARVDSSGEIAVVSLVSRTNPESTPADAAAALGGLRRGTVVATPWAGEGDEFRCLGPAHSNWFAAPGEVQVLGCPDIGAPVFGDAP